MDYCAGRLEGGRRLELERHLEECGACRTYCEEQQAVWNLLDEWEPEPVSWGFDRRVETAAAEQPAWWRRVLDGVAWKPALPVAAGFALWVLMSPLNVPAPVNPVQAEAPPNAEQVERALEDLEMLQQIRLNG